MLSEHYAADLSHLLLPLDRYHPFPTAAERAPWEALPQETRAALIEAGERHLEAEWPARLEVSDSGEVRVSLLRAAAGYQLTIEAPGNVGTVVTIPGPQDATPGAAH